MLTPIRNAFLAVGLLCAPVLGQAGASLHLVGTDGTSRLLSAAELTALPQAEVSVPEGTSTVTFRGPTLRDVLTLAGAPTGRSVRGPAMALVVLAEAADDYVVAFTVSELDPQFGNRTAIVAMTQDGAPMAPQDGLLQIVVPDDEFHARWVRQLVTLRLVQTANGPPAQPHE